MKDWEQLPPVLTDQEKFFIIFRFGIGNFQPQTLEQIGLMMNLSQKQLCKLEAKALQKIRHHAGTLSQKLENRI